MKSLARWTTKSTEKPIRIIIENATATPTSQPKRYSMHRTDVITVATHVSARTDYTTFLIEIMRITKHSRLDIAIP
jgi:hypothetical protein